MSVERGNNVENVKYQIFSACAATGAGFKELFYGPWYYPQYATIESKTLCLISRTLECLVFAYVIGSIVTNRLYEEAVLPNSIVSFWGTDGNYTQASHNFRVRSDVPLYCSNVSYNYEHPQFPLISNISCVTPTFAELKVVDNAEFFLPTVFVEISVRQFPCNSTRGELCSDLSDGLPIDVIPLGDGTCQCQFKASYFVVSPEEVGLSLNHHFWTGDKQGGINTMETRIEDNSGEIVETYSPTEYISKTVKEWMELAELSLEGRNSRSPPSAASPLVCWNTLQDPACAPDKGLRAFNRVTGGIIDMYVYYDVNTDWKTHLFNTKPRATLKIRNVEGWTQGGAELHYVKAPNLPIGSLLNGSFSEFAYTREMEYVVRLTNGIRFRIKEGGMFGQFQWYIFQNQFITGLVALSLVPFITLSIGLFCLGHKSQEISDQIFMEASGRSKNVQVFRRLVKDLMVNNLGQDEKMDVEPEELYDVLHDICPDLEKQDISNVVNLMDTDGNNLISLKELYTFLIDNPRDKFTVLMENALLSRMLPGPWKREMEQYFEERKWEDLGVNFRGIHRHKDLEMYRSLQDEWTPYVTYNPQPGMQGRISKFISRTMSERESAYSNVSWERTPMHAQTSVTEMENLFQKKISFKPPKALLEQAEIERLELEREEEKRFPGQDPLDLELEKDWSEGIEIRKGANSVFVELQQVETPKHFKDSSSEEGFDFPEEVEEVKKKRKSTSTIHNW